MINWKTISVIASNKTISATSVWIFLTPIIIKSAELLDTVAEPELSMLLQNSNLTLIYFAAVIFFTSSMISIIAQPESTKSTIHDICKLTPNHIEILICSHLANSTNRSLREIDIAMQRIVSPTHLDIDEGKTVLVEIPKLNRSYNIRTTDAIVLFEIIFQVQNKQSRASLYICAALQLIGAGILIFMLTKNLAYVITYLTLTNY